MLFMVMSRSVDLCSRARSLTFFIIFHFRVLTLEYGVHLVEVGMIVVTVSLRLISVETSVKGRKFTSRVSDILVF